MSETVDAANATAQALSLLTPAAQIIVALGATIGTAVLGVWLMLKGGKKHNEDEIADAIEDLRDENRRQQDNELRRQQFDRLIAILEKMVAILSDMDRTLTRIDAGQGYSHKLLEALHNEDEMRRDAPRVR